MHKHIVYNYKNISNKNLCSPVCELVTSDNGTSYVQYCRTLSVDMVINQIRTKAVD